MAGRSLTAHRLMGRLRRWMRRGRAPIWYEPAYRLPVPTASVNMGFEARRADFVVWSLLDLRLIQPQTVHTPHRIRYSDIARVHTPRLMDSLYDPLTLARILAVDPSELPLDEVIRTFRLACGGTLGAARGALKRSGPTLNLLGGFHHAEPDRGGGLCPINDLAIAVATLRADGLRGKVVVLDLDAHPPDGTAACLKDDPDVWIGSLSGSDWGPLPGAVDETVLPEGTDDWGYLKALEALLRRMPPAELALVVAGGDVLAGDRLGKLGLSLAGARRRDRRVAAALEGTASVWVPGGGYHADSWKVLLGTALVVEGAGGLSLPWGYDPMNARFSTIAQALEPGSLDGGELITDDDLAEVMGFAVPRQRRLLGFYTPEGMEYALFRYGITDHLARLGFTGIRVAIDADGNGDRFRVFGRSGGAEHLLIEAVLEKQRIPVGTVLYIHWMTMMNPLATFRVGGAPLPGQERPGLGLSREAGVMFVKMAERLGLDGVAFRPAWYHIAYAGRGWTRFSDPARQGRFEAMVRDLAALPLPEATRAVAEGRVLMNGEPYAWEADYMIHALGGPPDDRAQVGAERDRVRFTVLPPAERAPATTPPPPA